MTVHELLQKYLNISHDINVASQSLAMSDYCPTHDLCSGNCTKCWKHFLESEVK